MKSVWVIEQFDAEPYEHYLDGIHSIYVSKKSAEEFYNKHQDQVLGEDEDGWGGYYLSVPYEVILADVPKT